MQLIQIVFYYTYVPHVMQFIYEKNSSKQCLYKINTLGSNYRGI